jgi:NADPH:quinone reductase-like Zn-dependent oxidoreductase
MAQKIWIRKNGKAQVLSLESADEKEFGLIGVDEVIVDVHFSGINFADIMMRLGFYKGAPPKPFVPGYEFSGVVLRTGSNVQHVKLGDKVYGGTAFGGYVSRIKVPSYMVLRLPDNLSLEEGAALPVAIITSHAALFKMGRVRSGDRVLIDCATGGLGTIMLQMLRPIGVEITGLTSTATKKGLIESYGARALTHSEFYQMNGEKYDFVLNSQGGKSVHVHYDRLAPTGRIVCIGLSSGINKGKRDFLTLIHAALSTPKFSLVGMFDLNRGVFALNALKLIEDETYARGNIKLFDEFLMQGLKPHIGKVFAASEVTQAHQMIETKQASGKLLLAWQ